MKNLKSVLIRTFVLLLPLTLVPLSCKPASLEFVAAKKRTGEDEKKPDEQATNANPGSPIEQNGGNNGLPIAAVEVMKDGIAISRGGVNDGLRVRPGKDTRDTDNAVDENCSYPGIVRVEFDFGDGKKQAIDRDKPCDSIEVPHTWTAVGTYTVTMTVLSDEKESVAATTQIIIVANVGPSGVPQSQIPGQNPPSQKPPTQKPPTQGSLPTQK